MGFTVTANSNGTLIDAALAKAIFESGLSTLYISLDGFSPHSHDFIRNKPDLFQKLMSNLDLMDAYPSPQVIFSTILHRRSVSEVQMGLEMVKARGYQLVVQPLYQTFGEPYDGEWYRRSSLFPDDIVEVDRALDILIEEKAKDGPVCNAIPQLQAMKGYYRAPTFPNGQSCKAGFKDISLDPYGNFHLCYHLKPIGNVRDSQVEDLWMSQDAAILRQEVASCPRNCNLLNCNFERDG